MKTMKKWLLGVLALLALAMGKVMAQTNTIGVPSDSIAFDSGWSPYLIGIVAGVIGAIIGVILLVWAFRLLVRFIKGAAGR